MNRNASFELSRIAHSLAAPLSALREIITNVRCNSND